MELFDEEEFSTKNNNGNKKTTTIILVVIILLVIIMAAIAGTIVYLKQTTLAVKLNGSMNQKVKEILYISENDSSKVYVPIKKIASYLGYEAYDGDYLTKSEEKSKCYIECEEEVAMFSLNSKTLYKVTLGDNQAYEYFYIDEPVIAMNDELYTTIDGIKKAFNVTFDYDIANKDIEIYTMEYLINYYSTYIMNYGYSQISEDFTNQKTILDSMLVVQNEKEKVGVINVQTGEAVLEVKYDNVQYLQHTSDFLVTDGGKMGIISKNKKTKIAIQYDNIELMDYDKGLYCVQQDKKFGVIDFKGNIVINLDYDTIGIDESKFKENGIKNGYILADNLIPAQKEDLWGFFDTTGKQITECKYNNLGYVVANNKAGYSLIVVPDYNVIVVGKDEKYTLITATGKEIWDFFPFDSVYMSIGGGETSYKMTYNSETLDVCEYLDRMGYGKNVNEKTSGTTHTENSGATENQDSMEINPQNNGTENSDNNNENNDGDINNSNNNNEGNGNDNGENNGDVQENQEQSNQ